MTRDEALLKLLAIEPMPRADIPVATGWSIADAAGTVDALMATGQIAFLPFDGNNQYAGKVVCLPCQAEEAQKMMAERRRVTARRARARKAKALHVD